MLLNTGFDHMPSLSKADRITFIWNGVHSWVYSTSHLSQTRPMLSFGSVSHLTLHPIPEHQYPPYQIQIYSLYSHGVSTIGSHPNTTKRDNGLCLSKSWTALLWGNVRRTTDIGFSTAWPLLGPSREFSF
jgi:hypothetical protein